MEWYQETSAFPTFTVTLHVPSKLKEENMNGKRPSYAISKSFRCERQARDYVNGLHTMILDEHNVEIKVQMAEFISVRRFMDGSEA